MRGMILAAGRGSRMGALTDRTPKPLLKVGGRYLIEHAVTSLVKANVRDIVINISYLRDQIKTVLGDGSHYGVRFYYSEEPEVLETGGGIFQALPLLGNEPFIVLSADVITDYPLQNLPSAPVKLAHLVLVENPSYHLKGDFCLQDEIIFCAQENQFTFANVGVYRPELFAHCQPGKFRLGDVLKKAAENKQLTGEIYHGMWHNLGTPDDLLKADRIL